VLGGSSLGCGLISSINALPDAHPLSVVGDFSDIASVKRAAAEIVELDLRIAGLLNNAGIMSIRADRTAQGWDLTFATPPAHGRSSFDTFRDM
jgi:NAD(P)-dependent dehydrogenase (short-subunit alcohol dehydrogenase family)